MSAPANAGSHRPFLLLLLSALVGLAVGGAVASGIFLFVLKEQDKRHRAELAALTPKIEGGQLKEWEFPDAEHLRGGSVGEVFAAADYATSKPFEEVWTYYAKKVGYEQEYKANLTYGASTFSFGSDSRQYQIQILNSTNEPGFAKGRRPSAKSATLMRRGAGGNVTVFISRAKDEDKTYFTLIVEGK